jgi:hypothetical protein
LQPLVEFFLNANAYITNNCTLAVSLLACLTNAEQYHFPSDALRNQEHNQRRHHLADPTENL